MNGKLSRKIRKEVNRKMRLDKETIFNTISEENAFTRIKYAFKIIFKYKLNEPVTIK